jgi:hypothetical protein
MELIFLDYPHISSLNTDGTSIHFCVCVCVISTLIALSRAISVCVCVISTLIALEREFNPDSCL